MLSTLEGVLFVLASILSLVASTLAIGNITRNIRAGQGQISLDQIRENLIGTIYNFITLRPTFKVRPATSILHGLVAWGFMLFLIANANDLLYALFGFRLFDHIGILSYPILFLIDLFNVLILAGIVALSLRRFFFQPNTFTSRSHVLGADAVITRIRQDSAIVATFIFAHNLARLIGEAAFLATKEPSSTSNEPIANALAGLLQTLPSRHIQTIEHFSFWISMGAILAFLPYFAISKHIHLFFAPLNQLMRQKRQGLIDLPSLDLNDESVETFGTETLDQLPKQRIADAYACIMCFRCQDVCPPYQTGKPLSPAIYEVNKRYALNTRHPGQVKIADLISPEAVWACTTCGACVEVCPVGNEPLVDILSYRRHLAMMESSFPRQLESAFKGMERNSNPWNTPTANRTKWADGLNIPIAHAGQKPKLLWWVGCAAATDPRAQKTAQAFAQILQEARTEFAILGNAERCTGDSARRAGREDIFFQLAEENIATLNAVDAQRIVTACPHCLNTLKNEYKQMGANFQVVHHSQVINELIGNGAIQLDSTKTTVPMVFHDPCYLSRHNQISSEPRSIIKQSQNTLLEAVDNQQETICCGAGGGQFWKEEGGEVKNNQRRYQLLKDSQANSIGVGCPFCLAMLTDASKEDPEPVPVLDIAEVVATNMIRKYVQ